MTPGEALKMSPADEARTEAVVSPVDIPENEQREIVELYRNAVLTGTRAQLTSPDGISLLLPDSVYKLLVQILKDLSEGSSVAVLHEKNGLTTTQASRMLGMSRQFFVNLLDRGDIRHEKVGTHRRVRVKDLLEFKSTRDNNRRAALDRMVQSEVESGAGDACLDDYPRQ